MPTQYEQTYLLLTRTRKMFWNGQSLIDRKIKAALGIEVNILKLTVCISAVTVHVLGLGNCPLQLFIECHRDAPEIKSAGHWVVRNERQQILFNS